jgi:outer membrane phospholipase A
VPNHLAGQPILEFAAPPAGRLVLDVLAPVAEQESEPKESTLTQILKHAEPTGAGRSFQPDSFFAEHLSGYEPFYFIAGSDSPNAKFQVSFKYRLLNRHGALAQKVPLLSELHLAYTQTSLWDWNEESAPFLDSSYKPEILYTWRKVIGSDPTNWFRLDLQPGLQHESNGKAGEDSRSLNIAYIRPTLTLGRDGGFQLILQPRAWLYCGDLTDNPDLADYRGYADLRTILGWQRGLQLSALGRLGDSADHGSLQLDLTYPMMSFLSGSFSIYLHAQYFTGFGESLLLYDERSSAFRIGFSLYR